MAEHTPTPWRAIEPDNSNYLLEIVGTNVRGNEELVCRPPGRKRNANAAFIVKACNSHDALVKALEEIAAMDPKGIRADDLGRAARIAREALTRLVGGSSGRV